MTDKQIQDQIDAMRRVTADIIAKGPEACTKFLIDAGILDAPAPSSAIPVPVEGRDMVQIRQLAEADIRKNEADFSQRYVNAFIRGYLASDKWSKPASAIPQREEMQTVKAIDRQPVAGWYGIRFWGKFGYARYQFDRWVESHAGSLSDGEVEWLEITAHTHVKGGPAEGAAMFYEHQPRISSSPPIPQSENKIEGEPEATGSVIRFSFKDCKNLRGKCIGYGRQCTEDVCGHPPVNEPQPIDNQEDGCPECANVRHGAREMQKFITDQNKALEAEISSLKETVDGATAAQWKQRYIMLAAGTDEMNSKVYELKDECLQQGLRIKVLEKEIEVARQTAQRFLEQNVLLVDERGRYLEAGKKESDAAVVTIGELQAEIELLRKGGASLRTAKQEKDYRDAHAIAVIAWARKHDDDYGVPAYRVYDYFIASEANKNLNHKAE